MFGTFLFRERLLTRRVMSRKPIKKARVTEPQVEDSYVRYIANPDLVEQITSTDLMKIKKSFGVALNVRGNLFDISGDISDCRKAASILEKIFDWIDCELDIQDDDIDCLISEYLPKPYDKTKYKSFYTTHDGKEISPRTKNQERLLHHINNKQITIAHGCAGTGKTALSIASALKFLEHNRFKKLVVLRPSVTVNGNGNGLGFLPGDVDEKTFPYNSAIIQIFLDYLGEDKYNSFVREKKIVFESIALIRGATFDDSVVLIDESQNFTRHEIFTILTRIGATSCKVIISGDSSQSDVKNKKEKNGLEVCVEKLKEMDFVGIAKMEDVDIQRSKIVVDIVNAFEEA